MSILDITIESWSHPKIDSFKNFYNFLNHIDSSKVQLLLNMSADSFDDVEITKNILIVSTMSEAPRIDALVKLALDNPSAYFICLSDTNFYNYWVPPNVIVFKYRHWHVALKVFLENHYQTLVPIKSKTITKKFSSLSNFRKQNRAVITACLLTYAHNESVISWHNVPWNDHHDYLIKTVVNNPRFANLSWSLLNQKYLVDNYDNKSKKTNNYTVNMSNFSNKIYQSSLINFSNETTSFGLYNDGNKSYIRPGPFLTEKTWNPLLSGNILFSSAAPFVYDYLKNDYHLPINYSIDLTFDSISGDLDRYEAMCKEIQRLVEIPLADLIDQNIDNCETIQNTITNPDYICQFEQFNQLQSDKISEAISKLIS
jgi:hypothetical protein